MPSTKHPLYAGLQALMIKNVPRYGNKLFYSLGFLSMVAFLVLVVSGTIMAVFGPTWWLTTGWGTYVRSMHLWATQAFVIFILLHLLVVFFTSGFRKPRRLTWVLGVLMLVVVLCETEFGYVLRGDYSSQWRSLQGADFYNGTGLGVLVNPLNYGQIFGIHVVVIPLALLGLLFLHYLLVRILGIAKPYRSGTPAPAVPANHTLLFARGGVAAVVILVLAFVFPSPYIAPVTIQTVARQDPNLMGKTLVAELDGSSDTATYLDNIDPYTFSTRKIFIETPYEQYRLLQPNRPDALSLLEAEPETLQSQQIKAASDYFGQDNPNASAQPKSPAMSVVNDLITMAQAGLYAPVAPASAVSAASDASTATERFLSDTGVLEDKATVLGITTDQYGMVREEQGRAPGAWWLVPIGVLNHTVLANDDNGDRDGAIILGSLMLTLLAFPFIPYVNQLPDKLRVYKIIWR